MIILPRVARALHHPGVAALLGLLLIAIGLYGLVSGDIPKLWAALILAVGVINVLRLVPRPADSAAVRNGTA